jgi:hypothetical protein
MTPNSNAAFACLRHLLALVVVVVVVRLENSWCHYLFYFTRLSNNQLHSSIIMHSKVFVATLTSALFYSTTSAFVVSPSSSTTSFTQEQSTIRTYNGNSRPLQMSEEVSSRKFRVYIMGDAAR